MPISIPNITNAISVADANVGSLNSRRLTTGAVAVSSRITNATSATTATNSAIRISQRVEPVLLRALLEQVLERADADGHQHDARDVEVLARDLGARAVRDAHVVGLVDVLRPSS